MQYDAVVVQRRWCYVINMGTFIWCAMATQVHSMKVDFIVAGTQKGGTSALRAYLREHTEICMAREKEVHFFDNEQHFKTGAIDYAAYHSFFCPQVSHKIIGEVTPIYMYWYHAPRRIWQYNPDIKLIFVLRNPIERAYSHWNMERARGADSLSFWDAIHHEKARCRDALPYQHRVYSYLDRGFYSEQLRRFWTYFPREQTLVLKSEELRQHPVKTLERIYRFLGVSARLTISAKTVHATPYARPMSRQEREHLLHIFEHEVRELGQMLGWNCDDWLSVNPNEPARFDARRPGINAP